jgi:hypothetical protein
MAASRNQLLSPGFDPYAGFTPEALGYVNRLRPLENRIGDVRQLLGDDFQLYQQLGQTGGTWGGKTTTYQAYDPYGTPGQTFDVKESGLREGVETFAKQVAPLIVANLAGAYLPDLLGTAGTAPGSGAGSLLSQGTGLAESILSTPLNLPSIAMAPEVLAGVNAFAPAVAPVAAPANALLTPPIDYSLSTMPAPRLGEMAATQGTFAPPPTVATGEGLTLATPGVTQPSLVPTATMPPVAPTIGDPMSFINQPATFASPPVEAVAPPVEAVAPPVEATAPPPQLTPAAIESGLGTPGYGVNAAAAESGLFNPALIGTGAATVPAVAATTGATMATNPFQFLLPAAGNLLGAVIGANATKSATEASAASANRAAELQYQAQKEALDLQRRMYEENVARQQPYYQAGVNALAQLPGRAGAMPPAFQYRPEQLTTDPGYGFRLSEGLKALERSAAARGGLLSGSTGKALTRYGQDMASQEYGNAYGRALTEYNALRQRESDEYNRLAGLAGVGGTTAQQIGAAGQQYGQQAGNLLTGTASNVGNLLARQGQTAAEAALARGSIYGRGLSDIGYLAGQYYGRPPGP